MKTYFKFLVSALLFLASISTVFAQTTNRPLRLSFDIAHFHEQVSADSAAPPVRLEMYLGVDRDGLFYRPAQHLAIASYAITVTLEREDEKTVVYELAETDTVSRGAQSKPGQQFVYASALYGFSGDYKLEAELRDLNASRTTHQRQFIRVPPPSDSLTLGDIQFAMQIAKSTNEQGMFNKSGLQVIPNPRRAFGDGLARLSAYTEVYHLLYDTQSPGRYKANYLILDQAGELLYRIPGRWRNKTKSHAALYTSFDLAELKTGRYRFGVEVIDEQSGRETMASEEFTVFRKQEALAEARDSERRLYADKDRDWLKAYFEQIKYIASKEEREIFGQLKLSGQREFITQFWARRDPSSGTPKNEFKEDYILRLAQSKVNFSIRGSDGWKTDRGRVLLTYGAPDFIDKEHANPGINSHEIWHYETLDGGSKFYFVDVAEDNTFQLVHSTYRKERQNQNWEEFLFR